MASRVVWWEGGPVKLRHLLALVWALALGKLDLVAAPDSHRRVLAVLALLRS